MFKHKVFIINRVVLWKDDISGVSLDTFIFFTKAANCVKFLRRSSKPAILET